MNKLPYKYPDNIPDRIKDFPSEFQKDWIKVFNNAFETYKGRDDRGQHYLLYIPYYY